MQLEVLHVPAIQADPAHPPILFVHGSYCGAWIWAEKFMPYFASRGFSCHAMSLRGHGGSEGDLAWASVSDYIDDVATVAADLGGMPIVIGHSMG
ncbi:MAG TPA: alpha/beta fold hydrolase, partial [Telmatospirillum sp.]|nr:alpha/beta fold hydrolase [Telmatospirillum sp.]